MKHIYAALTVAVLATALFALSSCTGKKETKQPSAPAVQEDSLSEEFAFPQENTQGSGALTGDMAPEQNNGSTVKVTADENTNNDENKDADKVKEVIAYISEHIVLDEYSEPAVFDEEGYSVYYLIRPDAEKKRPLEYVFLLGTEKVSVELPTDFDTLIAKGFTVLGDADGDTEVRPGASMNFTLCTPETNEIIGFSASNHTENVKTVSQLPVVSVTLTSINNFSAFSGINGSSDIGGVLTALGNPDIISISSTGSECSVMLEYTDTESGRSVLALSDGSTKGLIALSIVEN